MFCPRCAAQNLDGAKFCRGCGTDLETVALALADRLVPVELGKERADEAEAANVSFRKRNSGLRSTLQGGILLGTALSIGIALAFFSNVPDWIIIWCVFFGWMACWGAISLAFGLGAILESRMISRDRRQTEGRIAGPTSRLLRADEPGYSRAISTQSITEDQTELREQERQIP